MRRLILFVVFVGIGAVVVIHAKSRTKTSTHVVETGTDVRAKQLIAELGLKVLSKESGYLGIIGVSGLKVNVGGRELAVQSQNYYMLTRERPINYLHRLEPDDTQILVEGGPVDYFVFHPDGRAEKFTLGMNLAAGE